MNWEAIGAIGETLGAVAVIASLIYLALQIRQNTKIGRITVEQGTFDSQTSLYQLLLTNPELIKLAHDFLEGHGEDPSENPLLQNLIMYALESHQHWFVQHNLGLLDEEALESNWGKLLAWVGNVPGSDWLQRNKHHFRTDFVEYVESRLKADPRGSRDVFEAIKAERGGA